MAEHKLKHLEPHFIYAGKCNLYLHRTYTEIPLRSSLLKLMKKYQIKTVMLTIIYMEKEKLITQEQMRSYCRGEQSSRRISVNEDLEAFFEDLQLGKDISNDDEVLAYYLPKLTEDEMALVEAKDENYFQKFSTCVLGDSKNPDVAEHVMKMSESESKFALGKCNRKTIKITNWSVKL